MSISKATPKDVEMESNMQAPHYDRGITPAETAARQEREGSNFMHTTTEQHQQDAKTDDQTDDESIRTTDGYTVDKEGLVNNYAIEPEMYIDEPGDLRAKEEAEAQERARILAEIKDKRGEEGKLTAETDMRGKGPGII
ncbi:MULTISPECIES: hypothetical protein [Microcoleus]|uniref:hypothetical protein n=1 Tax=Microcoleus TaxID=44471 RepID=UPI0029752A8F|nr:MAG: hypothetical protein EA000_15280 [Oscillatoriales cyanobacterium]TAE04319.1 MAG: hypothetical protein EAZ96_09700 [Oscillatoriales cyanobacterium]TAE98656.1 MAG: hypothetical protein EAZ78_23745 [Oscillatoriales cyanobacterium]TAF31971.1 MAG: hypothetical protein EAZ68_21425 [Oscillatoriales cyanobacterium]TAF69276.1 MAG: hypothetical protein EAZ59_09175 [Oscillatoriales cyanobacterium]